MRMASIIFITLIVSGGISFLVIHKLPSIPIHQEVTAANRAFIGGVQRPGNILLVVGSLEEGQQLVPVSTNLQFELKPELFEDIIKSTIEKFGSISFDLVNVTESNPPRILCIEPSYRCRVNRKQFHISKIATGRNTVMSLREALTTPQSKIEPLWASRTVSKMAYAIQKISNSIRTHQPK